METPTDRRYTEDHEWARLEDDGVVTVGITFFAQDQLGDVVYLELPDPETDLEIGGPFGVVESVKSVSDLYAPIGGVVRVSNTEAVDAPEMLNSDPYGDGWLVQIEPADGTSLDDLMTAAEYDEFTASDG